MSTYQVTGVQPISDTLAHFLAWAQTFGQALSGFGWVKQSGHGELVDNGSTGAAYAWANVGSVLTVPTTALVPPQNYRFNGAWVSGNTYTGSNTINSATTTDLVTFAVGGNTPITYVHITATSSLATTPAADTTNWQPFMYEIWKSNGTQSGSLPIYLRIVYTVATSANTGPAIHLSIGTSVDANGNIPTANAAQFLTITAPVTNAVISTAAAGVANTGDLNFAGDADNFRFILWRGITSTNKWNWLLNIERARTATGATSDAYVHIAASMPTQNAGRLGAAIIPNTALGAPMGQINTGTNSSNALAGLVVSGGVLTSLVGFGASNPFPIFPVGLGFLANPLLGLMGFNQADFTDGAITPVWMYGSSHNYLICKTNCGTNSTDNLANVINTIVPGILWE